MSGPTVGRAGEREIVRMIRRLFPASRREVRVGIGDDAAVIRGGKAPRILTKDLLIENIDFRRRTHPPFLLGRKSLAVNLSDAAAMGARPDLALLGLGLPADLELDWVREFLRGFRSLAGAYDVDLVGGDLSSAGQIVISVTVVGTAARPIGRGGARAGDWIFVSGTLGDAALGFRLMEGGGALPKTRHTAALKRAFLDPVPRLELGRELARFGLASAMIDISDGLSVDLAHLCQESGTGAEVDLGRIPLSGAAVRAAGERALQAALNGGEDFELLFTVRPTVRNQTRMARLAKRHDVTPIGRIIARKGIWASGPDGSRRALPARGFEHFR